MKHTKKYRNVFDMPQAIAREIANGRTGEMMDLGREANRTTLIKSQRHLSCPEMTIEGVEALTDREPEYITKHISASSDNKYDEAALSGQILFGTLMNYRAKEDAPEGLLGDREESRLGLRHNVEGGYVREFIHKSDDKGTTYAIVGTTLGSNKDLMREEIVANDYCYCASIGGFDLDRAIRIREHEVIEAKKPNFYVTYHLTSLKLAIKKTLSEGSQDKGMGLVGRRVTYEVKDRVITYPNVSITVPQRKALDDWLTISFLKARRYNHEEEFRILIVDPTRIGRLDGDTKHRFIGPNLEIAKCIVSSGQIPH